MILMEADYQGDLRCRSVHPSGSALVTDAPRDNHGKGEAFSPTDTLATALLTCAMTTMGIHAQQSRWSLAGMRGSVEKHMTTTPPRRVAKLVMTVTVPAATARALDAEARRILIDAGDRCPVRLSLADAVDVESRYVFSDEPNDH
jgi:putative redox protein